MCNVQASHQILTPKCVFNVLTPRVATRSLHYTSYVTEGGVRAGSRPGDRKLINSIKYVLGGPGPDNQQPTQLRVASPSSHLNPQLLKVNAMSCREVSS